jgi:hypothetical protein
MAESIPRNRFLGFLNVKIRFLYCKEKFNQRIYPHIWGKDLVLALMKERIPRHDKRDLLPSRLERLFTRKKWLSQKDKDTVSQRQKYSLTRKK